MSLTHLENGGWAIADLRRLSVYELDEDTGALIEDALLGGAEPMDSILQEAVASGVLLDMGGNGEPETERIDSER